MAITLKGSGQVIVQIVQQSYTSTSSTTSNSLVDSGLTVNITPTSSSNQILVLANINIGGGVGYTTGFQLVRNGTNIGNGTAGSSNQTAAAGTASNGGFMIANINFIDAPATTSACTYKVQWRTQSGSPTAYINRTQYLSGGSDTYQAGTISTLIVMEISGT